MAFEDDSQPYMVLTNDEGQYSLWPGSKAIPQGWQASGFEGSKADCLAYVDTTWKDMRPQSLRQSRDGKI